MRATQGFTIREASADDLQGLRAALTAAIEPYRDTVPGELFDAYLRSNLDVESRLGTAEVVVVLADGEIVGTVTLVVGGHDGAPSSTRVVALRAMAVHPSAQGSGAAAALLDECIRRAGAAGAAAIVLHTSSFLPRAIAFYERVGFHRDPDHDIPASQAFDIALPTADITALAYRLDLS